MTQSSRRDFLKAVAVGTVGVSAGSSLTPSPAHAASTKYDAAEMAASISAKLYALDGLARPVPDRPTVSNLAKGLDRTLVLGGGAYAFPRWLEAARKGSRVDVCEIDPAVTRAAYVACGLASNTTIKTFNEQIENYRLDLAANALYDFIWNEFCGWYLELTKPILLKGNADDQRAAERRPRV